MWLFIIRTEKNSSPFGFKAHSLSVNAFLRSLDLAANALFLLFSICLHKYKEYNMPVSKKTIYRCRCNLLYSSKSLIKKPESVQSHFKITLTVEKPREVWNTKGIMRKVRGGTGRRGRTGERGSEGGGGGGGRINDIRLLRPTLATWLFQNESNARPKNE